MTGVLGVFALFLAVGLFAYAKVREHQESEGRKKLPPLGGKFLSPIFVLAGITLICFNSIFFYSEPGMSYLVQYPTGTQKAVLQPGYSTRWFGDVVPFKKFVTVAFLNKEETAADGVNFSATATPQRIRFNDSVQSQVSMTARFELSNDPERFLAMAVAYRNQANLVHSSLIPIMQESMNNTGRMFSAQEYIGGKGGDFDNAVLDQIRHGIYLLDIREENNMADAVKVTDPTARSVQQGQTIRVIVSKRTHENGTPLRKDEDQHPLTHFGIQLLQANIKGLDHDPKFKENLEHQREAAAQVAIERQKARQQEERKKRIIAEGEAEKASKKIELEMKQIEIVLAAETESKKAEQEQRRRTTDAETTKKEAEITREQKAVELETARLEAQRILELARADAEKRKLLMAADNALSLRLEAYVKVQQAYAEALKGKQLVPTVVVGGSGASGNTNATTLVELLTAKTARELAVELGEAQKKNGE